MTITLEINTTLSPGQAFEMVQKTLERENDLRRADGYPTVEITGGSAQRGVEDTGDMCRHGRLICTECDPEATGAISHPDGTVHPYVPGGVEADDESIAPIALRKIREHSLESEADMTRTQQLCIESMKFYIRRMANDGQLPDHMRNMLRPLEESKLTEEQCRAITNLMRGSFNLGTGDGGMKI